MYKSIVGAFNSDLAEGKGDQKNFKEFLENDWDRELIVTHNGVFHLDEVMAIAMILMWRDKIKNECITERPEYKLVRTRDMNEPIPHSALILDVGEKFLPEQGWIDHHQANFHKKWIVTQLGENKPPLTVNMATTGCVWYMIGDDLIRNHIPAQVDCAIDWKERIRIIESIMNRMKSFIFQIDAPDVGQLSLLGASKSTSFSQIIGKYNDDNVNNNDQQLENMKAAIDLAMFVLSKTIRVELKKHFALEYVLTKLRNGYDQKYFVLDEEGIPWKDAIFKKWKEAERYKLVILPANLAEDEWRVQTLPAAQNDPMSMRCPAPVELRGQPASKLKEIVGAEVTFCHQNGFIGGAIGFDAAQKLAKYWIENSINEEEYFQRGKEFVDTVSKHGGIAKIIAS